MTWSTCLSLLVAVSTATGHWGSSRDKYPDNEKRSGEDPMFNMEKRSEEDPMFNLDDLVDWSAMELPGGLSSGGLNEVLIEDDIPGSPLTPDDFQAADFVKDVPYDDEQDPIELAKLFEGDIDNVNMKDLRQLREPADTRNAIRDSWRKWPGGVLPYVISTAFGQYERSVIAKAMKQYHLKTCIKFKPRTNERAYLHIMKGSGCSSSVGRTGSVQSVSLGSGCVYTGERTSFFQHEFKIAQA